MTPLLELRGVEAGYGDSQALFGVSLTLAAQQVVTLLGRNGMGKTTTVKAITGMLTPTRGSIRVAGTDVAGWASYRIARLGLGLVPEGRRIFPNLTVRENLMATMNARGRDHAPAWTLEEVIRLFPRLGERLENGGHQLSGGEQQMLAIGRALLTNPILLILDEATEGLAPLIRAEVWSCIEAIKSRGVAILLIDKNIEHLLRLADQHYVLEKGRIAWSGSTSDLKRSPEVLSTYLSV